MSTRNKGKQFSNGLNPWSFVERHKHVGDARDGMVLALQMFRVAFLAAEAKPEHWAECAGFINLAGTFAQERKNEVWLSALNKGADALRAISARYDRVGGRLVATEPEAANLCAAIDCIDAEILPAMTQPEFVRIATAINKLAKEAL